MRKVSPKRAAQTRLYNNAKREYMEENPSCENCGASEIVLHHKKGRRGERLTDKTYFMSVCFPCHEYIHAQPEWSYDRGYLIKG